MKRCGIMLVLGILVILNVCAFAEEPHQEEAPGVFSGNLGESLWTLIWFFVLLLVLWKFAWKPVLAGLQSRQDHIEKQISEAENTRTDASKVLEEYQAQLADAERQGRELVTQRLAEAERQAKEVFHQNQKDVEKMKVRLEAELEQERRAAEEDLWKQAGQIVQQLGRDVFGKTLDDADNQKLIDEAIGRLRESEQKKPETAE